MSVDGFARTAAISETPRRIGHLGASREQEHASTCQTPAADISDLVHPDQAHDTSAVGPGASRSFERLASAPGAIGVDGRRETAQYDARNENRPHVGSVEPAGNETLPPKRAENENRGWVHFQHASAANARGMSMTNLYRLAASLARPVARGWLSLDTAEDSLAAYTVRTKLGTCDPDFVFGMARWVLQQRLSAEEGRRELAGSRIRQRLYPLIALHKPARALFAEAHDVNGADGFPLDESEVNDIAATQMIMATPRHRRASHVR